MNKGILYILHDELSDLRSDFTWYMRSQLSDSSHDFLYRHCLDGRLDRMYQQLINVDSTIHTAFAMGNPFSK